MLSANVRVKKRTKNLGEKVDSGVRRGLLDAADAGFAESQEHVPDGATSGLRLSGFQPDWVGDELVWGYSSEYARFVEEGTQAHYPPIAPLKLWAHRVLGDEDAAWAVQEKIGQEGTEPNPYVKPGFDEMVRRLRNQGLSTHIDAELD